MSSFAYVLIEISLFNKSFISRHSGVQFPRALYHVTSRRNQRQKIYKDYVDYWRFEAFSVS